MNGYANGFGLINMFFGFGLINMFFFSHNLRSLVVPIILCKYLGKIVSHYSEMLQLSQIVCIFVAFARISGSCFAKSEENLTDPFLLLENLDIL